MLTKEKDVTYILLAFTCVTKGPTVSFSIARCMGVEVYSKIWPSKGIDIASDRERQFILFSYISTNTWII